MALAALAGLPAIGAICAIALTPARIDAKDTSASIVVAEMNVPIEIPREHGSIVDPTIPGPKPPKKKTPTTTAPVS